MERLESTSDDSTLRKNKAEKKTLFLVSALGLHPVELEVTRKSLQILVVERRDRNNPTGIFKKLDALSCRKTAVEIINPLLHRRPTSRFYDK